MDVESLLNLIKSIMLLQVKSQIPFTIKSILFFFLQDLSIFLSYQHFFFHMFVSSTTTNTNNNNNNYDNNDNNNNTTTH